MDERYYQISNSLRSLPQNMITISFHLGITGINSILRTGKSFIPPAKWQFSRKRRLTVDLYVYLSIYLYLNNITHNVKMQHILEKLLIILIISYYLYLFRVNRFVILLFFQYLFPVHMNLFIQLNSHEN